MLWTDSREGVGFSNLPHNYPFNGAAMGLSPFRPLNGVVMGLSSLCPLDDAVVGASPPWPLNGAIMEGIVSLPETAQHRFPADPQAQPVAGIQSCLFDLPCLKTVACSGISHHTDSDAPGKNCPLLFSSPETDSTNRSRSCNGRPAFQASWTFRNALAC